MIKRTVYLSKMHADHDKDGRVVELENETEWGSGYLPAGHGYVCRYPTGKELHLGFFVMRNKQGQYICQGTQRGRLYSTPVAWEADHSATSAGWGG